MTKLPLPRIAPDDLDPHWRHLVEDIGERRAGGDAEWNAAQYIAEQFQAAGLENVRLEPFECKSVRRAEATLEALDGDAWSAVPCEVLAGSPPTKPAEKPREMDLEWVEMPEQVTRLRKGAMRNRALCVFGPLGTSASDYATIAGSGAALVIWVDERMPFEWAKADGILPVWAERHGALPTVAIPYMTAYGWRLRGVERIRGCVAAEAEKAASHNVVADLPGRRADLGMISVACHHDTQLGNAGADDNASGVVAVLAMAKALAAHAGERPFNRTMRFISFGAEEQLSVGSRAYCLNHQREMKSHALMVNLDSIASPLGHTTMLVAGTVELERWARGSLEAEGLPVRDTYEVTPFADHFPFTAMGVPALWFHRPNFAAGRWQHHSVHDTLDNCSPAVLCQVTSAVAALVARAAALLKLPFPRRFRAEQASLIEKYARDLYDMA